VTATVDRIQKRIAGLTIVVALAWWYADRSGARGVLVGGIVVLGSVWLLARLFEAAIVTRRRRLAMALTFVKLAAFLGLGWIAFTVPSSTPDPVGFAVGVSMLPIAAVWEALEVRRR